MDNFKICQKCGRSLNEETQFYKRKDGTKVDLCKKCLTMHIDNFNPETFLWILEDMDYPYIPQEGNVLRDRAFAKNPNLNGTSVFGKYLSKMKLKQGKDFSWVDSEEIQRQIGMRSQAATEAKAQQDEYLKEQLDNGEITEAQYKTLTSTEKLNEAYQATMLEPEDDKNPFRNEADFLDPELLDLGKDLSDDDKIFLAMKGGRLYRPSEGVELEKMYNEMMESFDIHDADTINSLILICKTNLKMNQFLDQGDIEGFQKISKVSESLRKTAKFTAAQNKEQKGDFVDSVGELVAYCEKNGGAIPKYEIDTPADIVDKVIADLKNYTKGLIYEDKSLAKQIEDYLKKIEISKQQKQDLADAEAAGLDHVELDDQDYADYTEHLENLAKQDDEVYNDEVE